MSVLYGDVIGQDRAVAALRSAAARPVHAYLFVGPAGTGKRAAASSFAASLLCPAGGDGTCDICSRVLAGLHPDVAVVTREGPAISIETAREVTRLAARSPLEGERKVLILEDFHLVRDAGPALLKTIEEPPASTVFVILAEHVPPELSTIASRCARVDFHALDEASIASALERDGLPGPAARAVASAAGGRIDRARLLASDAGFQRRRTLWESVPARLDGSGATAVAIVDELIASLDESIVPLKQRHEQELAAMQERSARAAEVDGKARRSSRGASGTGARQLEARHQRELRRHRTEELRAGLAALSAVYRRRLAERSPVQATALQAVQLVDRTAKGLVYNPNEQILLLSLLTSLDRLGTGGGRESRLDERELR